RPAAASALLGRLVDDLVVRLNRFLRPGRGLTGLGAGWGISGGSLGALVERGPRRRVGQVEFLVGRLDRRHVAAAERFLAGGEGGVEPLLVAGLEPVDPLLGVLLDLVDQAVELVAGLDLLAPRGIVL